LVFEPPRAPLKAGTLRDVEIGYLDVPALGGKFAGEKAGKIALPHATLLGNDRHQEGHYEVLP
jgi:hypothetical protein